MCMPSFLGYPEYVGGVHVVGTKEYVYMVSGMYTTTSSMVHT